MSVVLGKLRVDGGLNILYLIDTGGFKINVGSRSILVSESHLTIASICI